MYIKCLSGIFLDNCVAGGGGGSGQIRISQTLGGGGGGLESVAQKL